MVSILFIEDLNGSTEMPTFTKDGGLISELKNSRH